MRGVYFRGNAPSVDLTAFQYDTATAYYLAQASGFGSTLGGLPTALRTPPSLTILNHGPGFGPQSGGFGFTISGAADVSVVIEAATSLAKPVWTPLSTNTLTGGFFSFTDPNWTKFPGRFYRVRAQ